MSSESAAFNAARERVLAQRAAREATISAQLRAQQTALRSSSISRLPYPLSRVAPSLQSLWSAIEGREGTTPAFRVGQVDSELLDEELLKLLKGQVGDALKYYGGHLQDDWTQEILLALRAILFKLSIWDNDASYGASLQNLRYSDARARTTTAKPTTIQKSFYGLFTVFGRYGWEKWQNWLVEQEGGYSAPSEAIQQFSRITNWASTFHSIAAFTSFLVFLVSGRYRTLIDRILRLRLVSPTNQLSREVSFEYLNRQLVWHAFTEFLLFLLPLVGISRWRRWLSRVWRNAKATMQGRGGQEDQEMDLQAGPLAYLPERTCAICYQDQNPIMSSEAEFLGANSAASGVVGSATTDIVNPYEAIPCGCIHCFFCIATKLEAEEGGGWPCLRCGAVVQKCRPWNGDVLVSKRRQTKTVYFEEQADSSDAQQEPRLEDSSWTQVEHAKSGPTEEKHTPD